MKEPQLKYHINWAVGGLLIGITFVCWLAQLLLTLTVAFIPAALILGETAEWTCELVFLFLMRSYFMRGRNTLQRVVALFFESVGELMPILNCLLPILPLGTWYQIHTYRADDRARYKAAHKKWQEEVQAQQRRAAAAAYQRETEEIQADLERRQDTVGELESA